MKKYCLPLICTILIIFVGVAGAQEKLTYEKWQNKLTEYKTKEVEAKQKMSDLNHWPKTDGSFIAYESGVVLDKKTGLEWVVGPDKSYKWEEAKSWAKNLEIAGGGWRMPTHKELETLFLKGSGTHNVSPLFKIKDWCVWIGGRSGLYRAFIYDFRYGTKNHHNKYYGKSAFAVRLIDEEAKKKEKEAKEKKVAEEKYREKNIPKNWDKLREIKSEIMSSEERNGIISFAGINWNDKIDKIKKHLNRKKYDVNYDAHGQFGYPWNDLYGPLGYLLCRRVDFGIWEYAGELLGVKLTSIPPAAAWSIEIHKSIFARCEFEAGGNEKIEVWYSMVNYKPIYINLFVKDLKSTIKILDLKYGKHKKFPEHPWGVGQHRSKGWYRLKWGNKKYVITTRWNNNRSCPTAYCPVSYVSVNNIKELDEAEKKKDYFIEYKKRREQGVNFVK